LPAAVARHTPEVSVHDPFGVAATGGTAFFLQN
jgi:hypothetical protein